MSHDGDSIEPPSRYGERSLRMALIEKNERLICNNRKLENEVASLKVQNRFLMTVSAGAVVFAVSRLVTVLMP